MKNVFAVLFTMALALPALAKTEKVCTGLNGAKGATFSLTVTGYSAEISQTSDDAIVTNSAKPYAANGIVQGRDGVTYVSYHVANDDGSEDLLVAQPLLQNGGEGLAKVRWQGEGFGETLFYCR